MKRVGLKDIAEHLGVSVALVSYVLNGQAAAKQVNAETAEKIRDAAQAMNYLPNQIAKSLKTQKTQTIGLVVADINYRFSTGITRAVEIEAKKNQFTVIYGSSHENRDSFRDILKAFINNRVDGLIVVPVDDSQQEIQMLQHAGIPFILVDRNFPELKTNYITLDNYKAAYNATSYLISVGCERIAFVNYETTSFHLLERNRGYRDALKDNKIRFDSKWLQKVNSADREEQIPLAMDRILGLKKPCDAVFFATDTLALHGLKFLNKKKLKVPEDISVLSFDESDAFELFYTTVTHSRQPLDEMGKLAVNALIDLIENKKVETHRMLEAELVIAESCRKS